MDYFLCNRKKIEYLENKQYKISLYCHFYDTPLFIIFTFTKVNKKCETMFFDFF